MLGIKPQQLVIVCRFETAGRCQAVARFAHAAAEPEPPLMRDPRGLRRKLLPPGFLPSHDRSTRTHTLIATITRKWLIAASPIWLTKAYFVETGGFRPQSRGFS